jgi:hypothetical protein
MKNKKYYTVGTVPKCNRKTVERCTGTSIEKYSIVNLCVWAQTPPLTEAMRP